MIPTDALLFPYTESYTADRLLQQRLRKSQSQTALDLLTPPLAAPAAESLHPAVAAAAASAAAIDPSMFPTLEPSTGNGQRLLVVANRLPVSAYKDKDGSWQFEVN